MIERGEYEDLAEPLAAMRRLHDKKKAHGNQDFAASVLVAALAATGERRDAAKVLDRYVHSERRELVPPPQSIYRAALEPGVPIESPPLSTDTLARLNGTRTQHDASFELH